MPDQDPSRGDRPIGADGPAIADPVGAASEDVVRIVEERLDVGTRRVEAGGVRVHVRAEARTETARVRLEDAAVEVERVPQGRFVAAAEAPRTEALPDGEVLVLPVYEERAVVETRLWLVEEVRVTTRRTTREAEVPVELRREVAEVEELSPLPADSPA